MKELEGERERGGGEGVEGDTNLIAGMPRRRTCAAPLQRHPFLPWHFFNTHPFVGAGIFWQKKTKKQESKFLNWDYSSFSVTNQKNAATWQAGSIDLAAGGSGALQCWDER